MANASCLQPSLAFCDVTLHMIAFCCSLFPRRYLRRRLNNALSLFPIALYTAKPTIVGRKTQSPFIHSWLLLIVRIYISQAPVSNLLFSNSLTLQSKPPEKQILIHTLTLSIRPSSLFTLEMFAATTTTNNHHHHENASNTPKSPVWTSIDLGHRAEAQVPHFRPTNLDLEAPSPSSNNNNNNNKKRHWLRRGGGGGGGGRNKSRKTVVVVCIVAVVSVMLVGVVGTAVVVGR